MRPLRPFLASLVLGLAAAPVAAQSTVVINTNAIGEWAGLFGTAVSSTPQYGAFESFGQTFTTPSGPARTLTQFSFWLKQGHHGPNRPIFHAYLYEWSTATNRVTGPELWRSASTREGPTSTSYQQFTWSVNTVLQPNRVYVAFLSTQGVAQTLGAGSLKFESDNDNDYANGQAVHLDGVPAQWSTASWTRPHNVDLRMTATLVAVPEPSTYALLATGLIALAATARRRAR